MPLQFSIPTWLKVLNGKKFIPVSQLTELWIYKDTAHRLHAEVVTYVPDDKWFLNISDGYQGIVYVKDWRENFVKGFYCTSDGEIMYIHQDAARSYIDCSYARTQAICVETDWVICKSCPGCADPSSSCYTDIETNCYLMEASDMNSGEYGEFVLPDGTGIPSGGDYVSSAINASQTWGKYDPNKRQDIIQELNAFDARIKDSLTHTCLDIVFQNIERLSGGISEIVYTFSDSIPFFNWEIREDSLPELIPAATKNFYEDGYIVTSLDFSKLKHSTDLAVAITIMHEVIHAYLLAYFRYDSSFVRDSYPQLMEEYIDDKYSLAQAQHDQMVVSYINQLFTSLKEYGKFLGYHISDQVYSDLAWSGLIDTHAFAVKPEDEKNRIKSRIAAEFYDIQQGSVVPEGKGLYCEH